MSTALTVDGGLRRKLWAGLASVGGSAVVMVTVVAMNQLETLEKNEVGPPVSSFEVKKSPPPKARKRKSKPKPRTSRRPAAPLPSLGVNLSGIDFGLPGLGDALADATTQLIGEVDDVVMTEDTVDELPEPVARSAAPYPPRARAKGIEGFVTVSMLVDADGAVKDLQVLEASPAGVFEDAALAALRTWRFDPAMYQGRAVAIRVRQTLRFSLE